MFYFVVIWYNLTYHNLAWYILSIEPSCRIKQIELIYYVTNRMILNDYINTYIYCIMHTLAVTLAVSIPVAGLTQWSPCAGHSLVFFSLLSIYIRRWLKISCQHWINKNSRPPERNFAINIVFDIFFVGTNRFQPKTASLIW